MLALAEVYPASDGARLLSAPAYQPAAKPPQASASTHNNAKPLPPFCVRFCRFVSALRDALDKTDDLAPVVAVEAVWDQLISAYVDLRACRR